jgi:ubiquinone/menaquinone biosynthesis C-methylase UbiE
MEPDEYRKLADVEDRMWYFRTLHHHVETRLHQTLQGAATARVLDAGCGTGGLIRRLQIKRPQWLWTGVDVSPLACALARQRVPEIEVVQASLTALPWTGREFDAVVSVDVLYHIEDDRAALRELWRVLRPGGVIVVNVPAYRWLWSYHDVAVHSVRRYARSELVEKLDEAGFDDVWSTHWNALPLPLVIVRRKLLPAPRDASDVKLYPAAIEGVFRAAMAAERAWLRMGSPLPFGSSVLAVARKPSE